VGIGTTSPAGKLELEGSGQSWTTSPAIRMWDSFNSKGWLVGNVNNITAGDFYIRTLPSIDGNPSSGQQEFTIKHATGNVGIGTTSPVKTLDVQGQLAISNNATSYWYLDRNDSSGNFDIINDSNQVKLSISSTGSVTINGEGDTLTLTKSNNIPSLKLKGSGTDSATIEGGNNFNFYINGSSSVAITSGGVLQAKYGISFPNQSPNATSTSEILNGYEEGNFTVTLNSSNGDASVSSFENTGRYVRVGNQVTVQFYSGVITVTSVGTGVAKISGLPYQSKSTSYHVLTLTHATCFASLVQNGFVNPGSGDFYAVVSNGTNTVAWKNASTTYFMLGGTYLI
jgi:hypothetical protein